MSARVLVGTVDGLHLFDDGGAAGTELAGREVTALAPSGDGGSGWVAVLDGRTLVVGEPGAGWNETATVVGPAALCIAGVAGGALVGTSEAHLVRAVAGEGGGARVVAGFDDVDGRDAWYTPWGGPADTRSLAVASDGTVFVNVHVGGIVRSADGGTSWEPTIAIDTDVHQVVAVPGDGRTVLAPCAYGLAVSDDGGDTWRVDTDGLHGTYSRAVAVAGDDVLVSASTGPGGERSAVYRYRREHSGGEGRFERCRHGLPEWLAGNVDTHTLAATPELAAFGEADGTVFGSADAGRTWDVVVRGLPRITCVAVAP